MSYEIVIKHSRGMEGTPAVSLGEGGIIYLNARAMRSFFKDVKHVHLLFDSEHQKVGIKPLKAGQPNSFKLNFSSQERKSTGMLTARSFLKALGLDKKSIKSIPAIWSDKNKLLEFEIKK